MRIGCGAISADLIRAVISNNARNTGKILAQNVDDRATRQHRYAKNVRTSHRWHHARLPDHSALLSGRVTPNENSFTSGRIQVWYNNTSTPWHDPAPHYHTESDEMFIVLRGSLVIEVEGEQFTVGSREFCCFPVGVIHSVIEVHPPVETLMIRAPSIDDKVYPSDEQ